MKFSQFFDRKELDLETALKKINFVFDKKTGIVKQIIRQPNFNDEPKFFYYNPLIKKTVNNNSFNSVGCSLNEKESRIKALAEAIERYCSYNFEPKLITSSYENLKKPALNPQNVASFSENQFETGKFDIFKVNEKDIFKWTEGISILTEKTILVPFQLVSMRALKTEKIIRIPITNGLASGTSLAGASCRAIWENIERDSFVITYLNKLSGTKIIVDDPEILEIVKIFARYKLELYFFDISTDINIPVVMSVLLDRTGIGPAVSMGVKCSLNVKDGIIGSIEEAYQFRPPMRKAMMIEDTRIRKDTLDDHMRRVLYWKHPRMIKHLSFLLDSTKEKTLGEMKSSNKNSLFNLKKTVDILKKKKIENILVECTTGDVRKFGFFVVRAISPELQPFYMSENYKYLGGTRLYSIPNILGYTDTETTEKDLNKIPHPF